MTAQTRSSWVPTTRRRRLVLLGVVALAVAFVTVPRWTDRSRRAEVTRLVELLALREGMHVGEVGAGRGWLTVEIARHVGPSGQVYANELSEARLSDIRRAAGDAGLGNVTVLAAGERTTNLPATCCDAVFMRRVYHHLTDATAILASIHGALRPGGRLAIIEFSRDGLVGTVTRMGIDRAALIDAVTASGFTLVAADEWPVWEHYVAVFEKPVTPPPDTGH